MGTRGRPGTGIEPLKDSIRLRFTYNGKRYCETLDALGIRRRVAYQTRHTYATLNLMAGVNPAYISRQMGHTNMQMLLTTYARWIDEADKGRERQKMESALG